MPNTEELGEPVRWPTEPYRPMAFGPLGRGWAARARHAGNVLTQTYEQAKQGGIEAMQEVFPYSYCDPKCTEAQLDSYHNRCGINDDTKVKAVQCGDVTPEAAERIRDEIAMRYSEVLLSKLG